MTVIKSNSNSGSRFLPRSWAAGLMLTAVAAMLLVPMGAQASRHKTPRTAEMTAEQAEALPPKLVVDTSGEKAAFANERNEATGAGESGAVIPGAAPNVVANVASGGETKAAGTLSAASATEAASTASTASKGVDVDTALAQAKRDAINKLPENEIPVLVKSKDEKKDAGGGMTRIFLTLGVLVIVFAGSSFALKRWAGRSAGARNQNTRIRILTQHHLGAKKALAIVQVAGESILIGITDQNISMLKTLSLIDDEVPEEVPNSFAGAMTDIEFDDDHDESGSNFALRGLSEIRDVVSQRLGKNR